MPALAAAQFRRSAASHCPPKKRLLVRMVCGGKFTLWLNHEL